MKLPGHRSNRSNDRSGNRSGNRTRDRLSLLAIELSLGILYALVIILLARVLPRPNCTPLRPVIRENGIPLAIPDRFPAASAAPAEEYPDGKRMRPDR